MDTDRDVRLAIGWNRMNMRVLGIWPDPVPEKCSTPFSKYRFLIPGFFMLGFIVCPQSANLVIIWGDIDLMTENLATANIPIFNAFVKLICLWYHKEALKPLLGSLVEDWKSGKSEKERSTMVKGAIMARRISIGCMVVTQTMVTLYFIFRILTLSHVDRKSSAPDRVLLYPAYFPFDARNSPIFELTCFGQIVSAYCASITYTSIDSFISMLVLHVCGQFSNLRDTLESLFDEVVRTRSYEKFRQALANAVKRHEHLNWFAKTIEECFNAMLLAQMLFCTIQLCFQGFQAFRATQGGDEQATFKLIFLVSYVGFILVHLYIYCYIGEMLLVQSSGMSQSAYKAKWYNGSCREVKDLLIIMFMSKRPLRLTAGKFGTFSLEMFSSILRTSMGYLSVLVTVTN